MSLTRKQIIKAAINWQREQGVEFAVTDEAANRLTPPDLNTIKKAVAEIPAPAAPKPVQSPFDNNQFSSDAAAPLGSNATAGAPMGAQEAMAASRGLAEPVQTLNELKNVIAAFDGLAVKQGATNMVFSDGDPQADIMLIGEAPGADEDREGRPFVGRSGQLLDKILASISLARAPQDHQKAVYITNILNWRPPGNRTPTAQEMEIARPFIEKHIALIAPKIIICCGTVAAQTLLHNKSPISKLRGLQPYPESGPLFPLDNPPLILATYHPAYLLRTPVQKRAVWRDMLTLQAFMQKNNLS